MHVFSAWPIRKELVNWAATSAMAYTNLISFDEIVKGREASVRVTDDGMLYAVDLVMVVTAASRDDAVKALRRLPHDILEVEWRVCGHKTKVLCPEDSIKLVMALDGHVEQGACAEFASIIRRYIACNQSLVSDMESDVAIPAQMLPRKQSRREDLELLQMEEEIQAKRIKNLHASLDLLTSINPTWRQTDAHFSLKTEDMVKTLMSANGPAPASLSISQLVQELGGRPLSLLQASTVDNIAGNRYKAYYNADPIKQRQWMFGAERVVNSFTEAERPMLTAVLCKLGFVRCAA